MIQRWIEDVYDSADTQDVTYIGSNFELLDDDSKGRMMEHFVQFYSNYTFDTDQLVVYKAFMLSLSEGSVNTKQVQAHLQNIFSKLQAWYNNPNNYVTHILPVVSPLLSYPPKNYIGSMLHSLLVSNNNMGSPDYYNQLCGLLKGTLPVADDGLSPYTHENLFGSAEAVVSRNHKSYDLVDVVLMLDEMVSSKLVDESRAKNVLDLAVEMWDKYMDAMHALIINNRYNSDEDQIVKMIKGTDISDDNKKKYLLEVLTKTSNHCSDAFFVSVLVKLYTTADPVNAKLWLDVSMNKLHLLLGVLAGNSLNNVQLIHLSSYLIERIDTESEVMSIIKTAVNKYNSDNDLNGIIRNVLSNKVKLTMLFPEARIQNLHESLTTSLISINNIAYKREFASWLKETKAGQFLRSTRKYQPSDSDLEILLEFFPRNKTLSRRLG
jgi:hypothetical protein